MDNPATGRRWKRADIRAVDVARAAARAHASPPLALTTLGQLEADTGAPAKVCLAALLRHRYVLDWRDSPSDAAPDSYGWHLLRHALPPAEYAALGGPPPPEPAKPASLFERINGALVHAMLAAEDRWFLGMAADPSPPPARAVVGDPRHAFPMLSPKPVQYRRATGPLSRSIIDEIRSGYRAAWFPTPPCSVTPSGLPVHVKPSCRCPRRPR